MRPEELQFKNIIVALDFSKFSRAVLKQAQALAERFKAHLHVIYVAEEPVFLAPPHFFANGFNYVPPREEEMQEDLVRFYKFSGKHPVSLVFEFGEPAAQIMKLAATLENPLIVAGATGRSALSRFVIGSQAEKLALEAPCPVWIHRGSKTRHFKYLLLPVDFSPTTQKVIDLFKASPVPLRLNYVYIREPVSPVLDYPTYIEI
jgi:nucleotide-binding universal stress UspA family protein